MSNLSEKNTNLTKYLTQKNNELIGLQRENIMKTTEITNLKEQIKKLTSVLNNMTKTQDDNVNKLNAEIKHLKETGISIVEERDKIKKELDNTKYELDNVKDQATEQLKEYGQNTLIKIQNYQSIIDKLKQINEQLFLKIKN